MSDGHTDPKGRRGDGQTTDVPLVRVEDARPDSYDGTCLRPLGLCELGGCCEVCWYRPDHPRFSQHSS